MKLFGMEVLTDESLLPNAVKFIHPSGTEQVIFIDGDAVVEAIDNDGLNGSGDNSNG